MFEQGLNEHGMKSKTTQRRSETILSWSLDQARRHKDQLRMVCDLLCVVSLDQGSNLEWSVNFFVSSRLINLEWSVIFFVSSRLINLEWSVNFFVSSRLIKAPT